MQDLLCQVIDCDITGSLSLSLSLTHTQCCIDNSIDMAELLLEYGADLNSRDIEGWTPLHAAAATGNVHLISILVDSGANLVAINHDDKMPVDVAADSDIKYILQQKMTEAGTNIHVISGVDYYDNMYGR